MVCKIISTKRKIAHNTTDSLDSLMSLEDVYISGSNTPSFFEEFEYTMSEDRKSWIHKLWDISTCKGCCQTE